MQTETQTRTPNLLPQLAHARNPGLALDLDWVASVQTNTSAIERRAATLGGRRSVKKEYQAAWLLKAISLIDLTTLSGDDTAGRVKRLCAKARQPVRADMLDALGLPGLTVGAVCVYHEMVETAVRALEGSNIPVAAVSTGFPAGLSPYHLRIAEIGESVKAGAKEIDIVISRRHVLTGSVALTASFPVEVLMKSAPAIMQTRLARATLRRVTSSPVARIALTWASPQAARISRISS